MIIFYNKETGNIAGTISGRVHSEAHLNMWIETEEINGRIVTNWHKEGDVYVPNSPQRDLFISLDNGTASLSDYKVNIKTQTLEKIDTA